MKKFDDIFFSWSENIKTVCLVMKHDLVLLLIFSKNSASLKNRYSQTLLIKNNITNSLEEKFKDLRRGLSQLWNLKISSFWGRVEQNWESTLSIKQFLSVFADIKTRLAFQVPIILECWPIIKWLEHFRKFSFYTGFTFCIWIYGGLRATY